MTGRGEEASELGKVNGTRVGNGVQGEGEVDV